MQLNDNICQCREAKRYTQDYVAEKLGMSQSTYSRKEKYSIINDILLSKIAVILGTTPDVILYYHLPAMPTAAEQTRASLQHKDEMITQLKGENQYLREENIRLHARLADCLQGGVNEDVIIN